MHTLHSTCSTITYKYRHMPQPAQTGWLVNMLLVRLMQNDCKGPIVQN